MIAALVIFAFQATAPLADPALEARARALDAEIRCVQCENEPISQSTADIAADMRGYVRERIAAGDSDDQIRAYFAARYGDFVLLRPRLSGENALLWLGPLALLAAGGALAWRLRRRASSAEKAPALEDERLHDEI
ncbi:MAG: cytochrome c-type biogenesis protein CcmH [Hyphomonadaceae bacterium]